MRERSTSSAPASGSLSAHACGATAAHSWSRRADQLQVATTADTKPAACEQRLLQLRCRDGRARAAYASSRARLSRQSVRPTPAADPIDFKLNCFPSCRSELWPKRKKQRKGLYELNSLRS